MLGAEARGRAERPAYGVGARLMKRAGPRDERDKVSVRVERCQKWWASEGVQHRDDSFEFRPGFSYVGRLVTEK